MNPSATREDVSENQSEKRIKTAGAASGRRPPFNVKMGGVPRLVRRPFLHLSLIHICLFLVMGHIDERDAKFILQADQFILHILAQFQIQGAQGLIQKQNLGLVYEMCIRDSRYED